MSESGSGWAVYERLTGTPFEALPEGEQVLVALAEVRSEVNNGGFDQYFFNSAGDHALLAVSAARQAGVEDLAKLLEAAIALLGPGPFQTDRGLRHERLAGLPERALEPLDERYLALESSQDLDSAMDALVDRS